VLLTITVYMMLRRFSITSICITELRICFISLGLSFLLHHMSPFFDTKNGSYSLVNGIVTTLLDEYCLTLF